MKQIFIWVILMSISPAISQNQWFEFGKPYFKLTVSETAIYKLKASVVENSQMFSMKTSELQMFSKGQQIAIKTIDSNKNDLFDGDDYILFLGKKNDGLLDAQLYTNPNYQLNSEINLHADSSAYFLTQSSQGPWLRVLNQTLNGSTKSVTEHIKIERINYQSNYSRGENLLTNEPVYSSLYGPSVGYMRDMGWNNDFTENIKIVNLNKTSSEKITVNARLICIDNKVDTKVKYSYKTTKNSNEIYVGEVMISNMNHSDVTFQLDASTFIGDSLILHFEDADTLDLYYSVAFIEIKYPQKINLDNSSIKPIYNIINNIGEQINFSIESNIQLTTAWNISSDNAIQELSVSRNGNLNQILYQSQTSQDKIWISTTSPQEIVFGRKVIFNEILPKKNLFIIITHPELQKSSKNYINPVRAYAEYRASNLGGLYDTMVVNTDYLYDYFTYGEYTPLAIRKFCQLMSPDTSFLPKALLLIGKGYNKTTTTGSLDKVKRASFVPTWGDPGSDIAFSIGLAGYNKLAGAIPTGRLSVTASQQVDNYLEKLIEHESLPDNTIWKKKFIHLTGGGSSSESSFFKRILENMARTAQGPYLGATVTSYAKTTDEFVQIFDLSKQLDEGVGLVNILGHSSFFTNDVRIGSVNDPSFNYKNKGKYPIIILNGCQSGNIFGFNEFGFDVFSESWINEPNKGSIGFYAHAGIGFVQQFDAYENMLYSNWFSIDSTNINKSFGEMIRLTSNQYIGGTTNPVTMNAMHIHQMNFMGDPMVKLFKTNTIDFEVDANDFKITVPNNKPLTALTDSALVTFVVKNNGIIPRNKVINIVVQRITPTGNVVLVKNILTNFRSYSDTFKVFMKLSDIYSAGENTIEIKVDPQNFVLESNKLNNSISILKYLPASDMNCLYPKEFSIQNQKVINLVAQSTDLLKSAQDYFIEIDTTFAFNSSAYQSATISATSLPTWENINLFANLPNGIDSVEFFWRIRFKAQGDTGALYANSSFIYIENGKSGWNQSKFHQFDKDIFSGNILKHDSIQSFEFVNYKLNIFASAGMKSSFNLIDSNQLIFNNKSIYSSSYFPQFDDGWNGYDGLIMSVFDSKNLRIYKPSVIKNNWYYAGISNESAISRFLFDHWNTEYIINDLITAIKSVPDGDYILLNPIGSLNVSKYDSASKVKFDELVNLIGYTKINSALSGDFFYGVFFRKGYGIIKDSLMTNLSESDRFKFNVSQELFYPQGTITSTLIGPSTSWGNFYYKLQTDNARDEAKFDIIGIDKNGSEQILFNNITQNGFDLSSIDVNIYPYLRLKAHLSDLGGFTPPIIDRWMVTYGDNIPEGTLVLDPSKVDYNTVLYKDEGDNLISEFQFKNISKTSFANPLIVQYTIKNLSGKKQIEYDTLKIELQPNQSVNLKHTYATIGFTGENFIEIYVNPKIQNEELYTNNNWTTKFNIKADNINPIMDVTFDGRKILNGEIVSPSPFIQISILDENNFLLKTDTSGIKILLKQNCSGCNTFTYIPMSDPRVKYYPATKTDKSFKIDYSPETLADGTYTLCVQGADASDNLAGLSPYCIDFNVINKSMMTNVYPYPNPFTNYTRFVFTITGSEVPDEMKIQIMTVSGKVVREIIQSEIGPIKIGTNISEYAWDGTDEYGDKLANGVYLYKVFAKHSGENYDKMLTGAEKAFKNDWGKLVILR